ncbi:MAG: S8 family serine peptidase [Verrucomicrobia bacterium]|nr:S8 family serine peptidase [Verrucomicrobiota bacterium]
MKQRNSLTKTALTAAAPRAGVWLASINLFVATLCQGQALPPVEISPGGPRYRAGEVLVQFKADVTDQQLAGAFQQGRLGLIKHIQTPAMKAHGRIGITRTATVLSVPEAVRLLNRLPGVEFAEPDWVATQEFESNDPLYLDGSLWGMFSDDSPLSIGPAPTYNPFGTQAEKAWAVGFVGSPDVFVGIIDQGIQTDHPDLAANIWTNPGEIPGNGIDDDGDGYVDDVHGWNAADDNGNVSFVDDTADIHGTHVAGTIGAVGGNGIGVAGVNWNVTMISGKFLKAGTGYYSDAIQAIDYMTTLKTRKGLNIVALNHSWAGTAFSQALLDAFTRAAQAGILSVAAAANSTNNIDVSPVYPAALNTTASAGYDAVISVAGINRDGNKRTSSNYGATNVDLGAPGGEVFSTVLTNSYGSLNGTSMATPHVTGAVALYASTHPGSTPVQTRNDLLTAGVRPLASLEGITVTGGSLDVGTLMAVPANGLPAPAAPANLQATPASGTRVDLSWADQSNNELGFALERSTDGVTFYLADTVGAGDVNYSDRTVQPGNTYFYRVRAYNPGGSSGYADAPSVTTPAVSLPNAPSSLTATALSAGYGVRLAWKDNSNNEDSFQIERKTSTTWQLLTTVAANTKTFTDASAARRTSYSYRVRAFNVAGSSAYSNQASVTTK